MTLLCMTKSFPMEQHILIHLRRQFSKASLGGPCKDTGSCVGIMWQNGESQNSGNSQCDLGQVTYFLSLGFLIDKMETGKSDLRYKVVVNILSVQSIPSLILVDPLSSTNLWVPEAYNGKEDLQICKHQSISTPLSAERRVVRVDEA